MSIDNMNELIISLAKTIDNNEKIATPKLSVKLAKCLEAYPEDQTIGAMSRVIDKMANNNVIFIKRSELKDLYNKLYSRNSKFSELFSEELGIKKEAKELKLAGEKLEDKNIDSYKYADPILSNALNSVFDKKIPLKLYSEDLAKKAEHKIQRKLNLMNVAALKVQIDNGNDKFLIVKADYETPKGVTSVYIPVEVINNNVSEPNAFVGNGSPEDLTQENITNYIMLNAGNKLKIASANILDALVKANTENRNISGAELALIRLNASRKTQSDFFDNQIVGLNIEKEARKDVEISKSNEYHHLKKNLHHLMERHLLNLVKIKLKLQETIFIKI